jgi:signal transduction histidine kinase
VKFTSLVDEAIVQGDDQLLNRIFSNIILNGLQSVELGTVEVQVALTAEKENYLVAISDNGKGIDPELIGKIFIPHFSTKKTGSGLGLAISKQGIEQSGGKIWFDTSTAGTTFYVSLPISKG